MELLYLQIIFIDMIGGGSGRLFELFGGLTVRYVLFFIGLLLIFLKLSFSKIVIPRNELIIFILGTFFIPIGMITMGTNDLGLAMADLKPFFFFALFFLILSQNETNSQVLLDKFCKYLLIIPTLMGILQIVILLAIKYGVLPFQAFYVWADGKSGEILFRGEDGYFFYKGFFFLALGFIYAYIRGKKVLAIFLLICVFLSQTRGLLLASIFTVCLHLALTARKQVAIVLIILSPIALFIVFTLTMKILFLREDAGDSNAVRFKDLAYILDENSILQNIIGNGWGAEVRGRARLENIFMELFFKTGIPGLLSSFLLSIYVFFCSKNKFNPFIYLMFFSLLVSQTNPFIFTPMGIILTGVCILSCRYYYNRDGTLQTTT